MSADGPAGKWRAVDIVSRSRGPWVADRTALDARLKGVGDQSSVGVMASKSWQPTAQVTVNNRDHLSTGTGELAPASRTLFLLLMNPLFAVQLPLVGGGSQRPGSSLRAVRKTRLRIGVG